MWYNKFNNVKWGKRNELNEYRSNADIYSSVQRLSFCRDRWNAKLLSWQICRSIESSFTEDEINDLLSLAQGFSLRQVAKASTKKISHATMKKFETEAAITVNEEMYRRHYLHSEDDQYFFTQSSEYQLSKEYRQFDISMLVRLIRICIDYDTISF